MSIEFLISQVTLSISLKDVSSCQEFGLCQVPKQRIITMSNKNTNIDIWNILDSVNNQNRTNKHI